MSRATRMIPSADNRPAEVEIDRRTTSYFGWSQAQLEAEAMKISPDAIGVAVASRPAAAKPKEFVLANANQVVRFTVHETTVTISTTKNGERIPTRLTTTKEHARAEYARLKACGFWQW